MLEIDDYGTVLGSAAVAYPRRGVPELPEQAALPVTLRDGDADSLRLGVPIESRSYGLHGLVAPVGAVFFWQALRDAGSRSAPPGFALASPTLTRCCE